MIVKMKFLSISGPKNDIDRVCEVYLSKYEMQLENAAAELKTTDNLQPFVEVNPYKEPLAKAEQFSALLADEDQRIDVSMNQEDMLNLIRDVNHDYLDLLEKKELTKKQVDEYKEKLLIMEPFRTLELDMQKSLKYKYMKVRFGRVDVNYYKRLEKYLFDDLNAVFIEGTRNENYVYGCYFVSNADSSKVDSVFNSLHFERIAIPSEYIGTPAQACEELEKEIEEIETEKQEIDDLTAECDKTKSLLKGKIEETKKQLETDENEFAKEYKNFENMLNKKGFDSIDSYKESILEDEQITLIEEQIEKYRDELNRLKSEIAVLNDMLADESIIDTEELLQAKLEMQVRVKQLNKENEDIISKLGNNVSVKKKIVNLLRDRGELDKKYRVIASLNNAANNKKIHFQTFVLRQYFNMVISYANKRLAVMTSNNFLLRCRDISFSTAGETGLELDVYSPVTGKVRDAHSLSGGETFMASLAMALGMSDIVQNKSGKTNIDTMFIDEGFGSLSDDVRDKAVRILLELAGSSRTVGVISHVSELKEQIPSKILVRKENDGSHITWSQDR